MSNKIFLGLIRLCNLLQIIVKRKAMRPVYKTLLENIWYFVLHSTKYHPIFVLSLTKDQL